MVKFRSLMFREFRISRKSIILQFGLLFAWIALTWGLLLTSDAGLMGGALADIIIMMTALYSAMYLLIDEIFKADINSGWLNYSYALPITPLERTAARFVRRASVCLASALIGLCHGAALCANTGKPFGANYIVWYIIVLAAAVLSTIPNNIFTLRARSQAELKKAQTTAGLTMTGIMAVLIVVIFLTSGADLKKLAESGMQLPEFTAAALAWALPLLILMMAASFFTAYSSLRSAYQGAPKSERESSEENEKPALPAKTYGAVGLLYKELKQNRLALILAACAPLLFPAVPFCFWAIEVMTGKADVYKMFEMSTHLNTRVLVYVLGFFAVSGLMTEVFKGDDKKLWAYFVVSLPQGVKGFMYRKYIITFMMNLIYMISGIFTDHLLATVNYFVTGTELTTNMQGLYISGVFMLLFTSAFDIPFTVRYGSKKGSMIKTMWIPEIILNNTIGYHEWFETYKAPVFSWIVGFGPALANVFTRMLTREGWHDSLLHFNFKGNLKYYLFAVLTVSVLGIFQGILATFAIGGGDWSDLGKDSSFAQILSMLFTLFATAPLMAFNTFGEEFGWRGYMNQKMEPLLGTTGTIIVGGILWGLWHAPLTIEGHNFGTDYPGYPYLGIICMCVSCMFRGIFLMWLTKKTNSIYPAAIFHAMNNFGGTVTAQLFISGIPEDYSPTIPQQLLLDIPFCIAALIIFTVMLRSNRTRVSGK